MIGRTARADGRGLPAAHSAVPCRHKARRLFEDGGLRVVRKGIERGDPLGHKLVTPLARALDPEGSDKRGLVAGSVLPRPLAER